MDEARRAHRGDQVRRRQLVCDLQGLHRLDLRECGQQAQVRPIPRNGQRPCQPNCPLSQRREGGEHAVPDRNGSVLIEALRGSRGRLDAFSCQVPDQPAECEWIPASRAMARDRELRVGLRAKFARDQRRHRLFSQLLRPKQADARVGQ
jgi:hypothetical protein